jgi:hypothetical protein
VMATTAAVAGILRSSGFGAGLGVVPEGEAGPETRLRRRSQAGVSWNPWSNRLSST